MWSTTVKEDLIMNDWVQTSNLPEVLQQGNSTPTWKPNEGPKKAMLDRMFVTPDALLSPELSM
jgi:hypothetical protein